MTKEEKAAKRKEREAEKKRLLAEKNAQTKVETPLPTVEDTPIDVPATVDTPEGINPILLNEEQPKETIPAIEFIAEITHDGVTDAKNAPVAHAGNIYARIHYTNKGKHLNYALIGGRIAQDLYSAYQSMGKGIPKKFPFNVKIHLLTTNGEEMMKVELKTRLNNPVNIAFAVANLISRSMTTESAEALLTGDFVVSEDGKLFNKKLGLPAAADSWPYFLLERARNDKRKAINKGLKDERLEVNAAINKMDVEEFQNWQKEKKAKAELKKKNDELKKKEEAELLAKQNEPALN